MTKKTMTIQDLRNMVDGHDGEDRISTLPDELIEHIFSFVSIKLVVQVCLLSKRWRKLWTTLGSLNFRSQYYDSREPYDIDNKRDESHKFVHSFLAKRDQHSRTSEVLIDSLQKPVGTWIICYAIANNVKHLRLYNYCGYEGYTYNPSYNYFSFPILESLHITSSRQLLKYWSMPSLTKLYLEGYLKDYSKTLSFEGFDNLKELTLKAWDSWGNSRDSLMIKSPKLVCLTISSKDGRLCKLVISAPKLSSFKFSGKCVPVLSVKGGFPCLKEVDLNLCECQDNINEELMVKLNSLFTEFRATKFLILSWGVIQVLRKLLDYSQRRQPSPFSNLKTLHILRPKSREVYFINSFRSLNNAIKYLFKHSSNVKIFIQDCNSEEDIMLKESYGCRVVKISTSPIHVDAAVLHRVTGVRPPWTGDKKFFDHDYSYRSHVNFSLWEGHHVYQEHLMLLNYIKKKQPQTFEHFAPHTATVSTLALNALCSSVKALADFSSLSASSITHFGALFTDLERSWGFNTSWLVDILNNVSQTSPADLIHEKQ